MKVSAIIPTLNAGAQLTELLRRLLAQSVDLRILVVDSGSTDDTLERAHAFPDSNAVELLQVPPGSFDHGGTRDLAFRHAAPDVALFLTQDALPADERCVEHLLTALAQPDVAAVFGRQVAPDDAPAAERLTRAFNYPEEPCVWREADIARLGVKAYFFSNVCAAYRRDAYEAAGGFDAPVASNEDMLMAAKLLHAGHALAYAPDACVLHAHRHTLREDYARNWRSGYVMETYRDRLPGADASAEGLRYVRFVCAGLARERRFGEIVAFGAHAAARLAGNRAGKRAARKAARS